MSSEPAGSRAVRASRAADAVFAATVLALGLVGFAHGGFTSLWSGVPKAFPARTALAYACAGVAMACGAGFFWPRTALVASRALVAALALWMLLFRIPGLIQTPTGAGAWWAAGESAALIGAAMVLARPLDDRGFGSGVAWLRVARAMFGFGLIQFGIGHFTYLARTVSMVPEWLPGHLTFAVLTGGAFIAAGLAVMFGVCARLAAALVTAQIAAFTVLVWIPVIAGHPTASDWTELVSSWLLTSAAWVVASSYRGARWLASGAKVAPAPA